MPSDLTLKTMNALHRVVMKLSFGKIGWQAGPMPVVELTTTGRKSGEPRTKPLIYEQDGDRYVIVASKGGASAHPDWYLNLQKEPNVELQLLDEVFPARVRAPRRARSASDCGSSSTSSGRTTTATRRRPTARSRLSSWSACQAEALSGRTKAFATPRRSCGFRRRGGERRGCSGSPTAGS
jgi:deazaflavin-dependent oxidoreductase (nitroreductase family)